MSDLPGRSGPASYTVADTSAYGSVRVTTTGNTLPTRASYFISQPENASALDGDQDGNWVKAHYSRDNGYTSEVGAVGGIGHCADSDYNSTNRVAKHRSQQIRDWATDPYGPWKYRP